MNINCDIVFDEDNLPMLNEEMNFTGEELDIDTLIELHDLDGFDAVPRLVCMIKDNNQAILYTLRQSIKKEGLAINLFSQLPIESKVSFVFGIRDYSNIKNMSPTVKIHLIKSVMNNQRVSPTLLRDMTSNGNF